MLPTLIPDPISKLYSHTLNLFIDMTKINNKYGSENVGINGEYRKNIILLSAITDENKTAIKNHYYQ